MNRVNFIYQSCTIYDDMTKTTPRNQHKAKTK